MVPTIGPHDAEIEAISLGQSYVWHRCCFFFINDYFPRKHNRWIVKTRSVSLINERNELSFHNKLLNDFFTLFKTNVICIFYYEWARRKMFQFTCTQSTKRFFHAFQDECDFYFLLRLTSERDGKSSNSPLQNLNISHTQGKRQWIACLFAEVFTCPKRDSLPKLMYFDSLFWKY